MTYQRHCREFTGLKTFDAPSLAEPAEVDVTAEWGAPDAVRGVKIDIRTGNADDNTLQFTDLDLSLDQAQAIGTAILEAVGARKAHPPTPAEAIQGAIEDVRDLHPHTDEQGREYIRVHDLLRHPEVDALDAEELLIAVNDTADDGFYEFTDAADDDGDAIRYQSHARTRVIIGRHH